MSYTELMFQKIKEDSFTEVVILLNKIKNIQRSKKCLEFLRYAILLNKVEIAELLLDLGVNPNGYNKHPHIYIPILHAVDRNKHTVKLLMERGANPNIINEQGHTPLTHCCGSTNAFGVDMFHTLIDSGADLETKNIFGNTPLICTIIHRKLDLTKKLVETGANLYATGAGNHTPLHVAVHKQYLEGIEYLLEQGVDVDHLANGYTSVHLAATKGSEDIVKLLVKYNADITIPNEEGKTPLLIAAEAGNTGMVKLLHNLGADMRVKDKNGLTALDYVERIKNETSLKKKEISKAEYLYNFIKSTL